MERRLVNRQKHTQSTPKRTADKSPPVSFKDPDSNRFGYTKHSGINHGRYF